MSNKFEGYQRSTSAVIGNMSAKNLPANFSTDSNSSVSSVSAKAERESIHSGQFMISTFEAEETQDDLDDGEVKMLDPEDPSLSKLDENNTCLEVQLYVPRKIVQQHKHDGNSVGTITSHLEIETTLSKLFKCLDLTYSQKLTSPKWNHFKGVRLRWKDKIRLNNVIWRCWHMQFILKRRTPVCQFASPLDVDVHSNPQSIVLEGKYWKRQMVVIKAEYRKWRRNFKSKVTGSLKYDRKSDLDFLEWSPLNDKNLMISEDWTSDTLFSSINVPFPFPDSREIARGASIADFIQPSLGPLQPNLDDIEDITFHELLQNPRLASVPEEGSEEMLKNVVYGLSEIMDSEQIGSNNMMDVSTPNVVTSLPNTAEDANMLELNSPLNTLRLDEILNEANQSSTHSNVITEDAIMEEPTLQSSTNVIILSHTSPVSTNRNSTKLYVGALENHNNSNGTNNTTVVRQSGNDFPVKKGRISKNSQRPFRREPHNYDKAQPTLHQTTMYQQMLAEQQKAQQAQHQQQLQRQQHLQSSNAAVVSLQHPSNVFPPTPQQQQHFSGQLPFVNTAATLNNMLRIVNNTNVTTDFAGIMPSSGNDGAPSAMNNSVTGETLTVRTEIPSSEVLSMFNLSTVDGYGTNSSTSVNSYKPSNTHLGTFKKSASTGAYINICAANNGSLPQMYLQQDGGIQVEQTGQMASSAQSLPSQITTHLVGLTNAIPPRSMSQGSPTAIPSSQRSLSLKLNISPQSPQINNTPAVPAQQTHLQTQQVGQTIMSNTVPKEMYRSNSLPLSSSIQKLEMRQTSNDHFVVPKYQAAAKSVKSRMRSNSIHHHLSQASNSSNVTVTASVNGDTANPNVNTQLHTATSDPMMNSTLAQLLTANSQMSCSSRQQNASSSTAAAISTTVSALHGQNKISSVNGSAPTNVYMSAAQRATSSPPSALIGDINPASIARELPTRQSLQHCGQTQQQQPLHKSPKKSNSLPTQITASLVNTPSAPKILSYALTTTPQPSGSGHHQSLSPENYHETDSQHSPTHIVKYPRDSQRRAGHIHAEQKRRCNIKYQFDQLHNLIPQLHQNNSKLSKAAMLQKGAEYIKHLRNERDTLKERMEALRMERDALNNSLTHLHSILPANGAPVTRQGTERVRQLYEQYVRYRTMENWKFWILGLILEPLLSSYTTTVSSASLDELRRTAFLWVDQHCSLIDLRPAISNKLKYLMTKTDILSDPPSALQEEVAKAVNNTTGQHPNLHGA
uniref:BHLH domain-containing protein n=1 Tax=Glossina brevipalpis TaxID=37001 RepID=A0A1A9WHG3_9MUSC